MNLRHKRAVVYRTGAGYFIHAESRAADGIWFASLPAYFIDPRDSAIDVGVSVAASLAASSDYPVKAGQSDLGSLTTPVLKMSRFNSWSALQKVSAMCTVALNGHQITITPTRNDHGNIKDHGYREILEAATKMPASSSEYELGTAVIETIKSCR